MKTTLTMLPLSALLLLTTACGVVSSHGGSYRHYDDARFTVDEPITRIVVDNEVGNVVLHGDAGETVSVDAELSWRSGPTPELQWQVAGDTLYIEAWCPNHSDCTVDLDLVVPDGFDADITTDVGTIEAHDVSVDAFEAVTDVGAVLLDLAARPASVHAATDVGEIVVRVPAGAYDVTTETDIGSITVDGVSNDPSEADSITAVSEVGDVRVIGR